ncbi:MAG: serine/threonine protein kinase [Deltaproteobacteria bacterium]|nr:serine/threonine protein kinase [Deltaproteobacteria bacterium]
MTTQGDFSGDLLGRTLGGKYRVTRLLGSGGMGCVYEAENVALGKRVAVKLLHVAAESDAAALARFQLEARAICAVDSDHVVKVFDWGQGDAGAPYLVMELLEGRDLAARLERHGRLPVDEAVRFAVEALRGLRKVHQAGIVHRDLKPENLLLVTGDDDRLHLKIVDFGLSKLIEPEPRAASSEDFERTARLTRSGTVVGTPLYMAPEQIEGLVEVDARADVWALGAILYEMLAGAPPFLGSSYARLVMAICQRDPSPISRENSAVSVELEAVIARAMTRERDRRFASADEFLSALVTAVPEVASSGGVVPTMRSAAPKESVVVTPREIAVLDDEPSAGPLDATILPKTRGASTVWLSDTPIFSIWRGEVESPDRLRIETLDDRVRDLRLTPVGVLRLGRAAQVGAETNELVYPDVASRLAARLVHDGVRWWLERRDECSVPVLVGERSLGRGERAPLVHGVVVAVGAMRATFVDRRYVTRQVVAGTIDPASGLLARGGLEQEVATALQRGKGVLALAVLGSEAATAAGPAPALAAVEVHRAFPQNVVARIDDVVVLLARGQHDGAALAGQVASLAGRAGRSVLASGFWALEGEAAYAGSEVELALDAVAGAAGPAGQAGLPVDLRSMVARPSLHATHLVLERAASPKHQLLLFGLEEQSALSRVGPQVIGALEKELAAVIGSAVGPGGELARLAPGVLGAAIPRKVDATTLGIAIQCEWHARAPVTDGKLELPRTVSWEECDATRAEARAAELSRECADAHGVLSALSGGLPYPIAGRVHAAIAAESAVERVKMLFDVLEGAWRFIAIVLGAAYFAKGTEDEHASMRAFCERHATRTGLPLGAFRELARLAVKGFGGNDDPIGHLARQVLEVKVGDNQTFEQLSNLMHSERNAFAHGHYGEARAAADLPEFEHMTRTLLRALRPLCAWTLVTVQRTEPDLFGESQTVEFVDHTGPHASGARRRFGFASPMRLANVVYLARWRDGLVLPLEPFVRRVAHEDRFELFWMDHLPRPGACTMSAVVTGQTLGTTCDPRRLPPLLRTLVV